MKKLFVNDRFILKPLALLISISLLVLCLAGCGSSGEQAEPAYDAEDTEIITGIVDRFMPLTEIPRQSHHEEQISEYLYSWADERGFNPQKDKANNVIFDVPATEGMEKAPLTILQGHMDMVIAVEDGKDFDPQKDGITVINDGKTMTADGTSLGADDGMGLATILYCVETNKCHGPLRVICTTNEEDGMTGVFALSKDSVAGAEYVINLDSENTKEVTTSSAAGIIVDFAAEPDVTAPKNEEAFDISIKGLLGGHSGIDIDKGHINGIKAISAILDVFDDEGIDYELASVNGGNANNAIPVKATARITINSDDEKELKESAEQLKDTISTLYEGIETDVQVKIEPCDMPEKVMTAEYKADVLTFIDELHDGVNSMSKQVEGLVESSSNLGLIDFDANKSDKSTASSYIRSSSDKKLNALVDGQLSLAKKCGFEAKATKTADPWPVRTDSKLLEMVKSAYLEVTGTEISVVQLHAGLETGTFSKLNPALDIVSIGIDVKDPHTVNETCTLTTLPTAYGTLEKVLKEIGNSKSGAKQTVNVPRQ